jgi:hypothetical protein
VLGHLADRAAGDCWPTTESAATNLVFWTVVETVTPSSVGFAVRFDTRAILALEAIDSESIRGDTLHEAATHLCRSVVVEIACRWLDATDLWPTRAGVVS